MEYSPAKKQIKFKKTRKFLLGFFHPIQYLIWRRNFDKIIKQGGDTYVSFDWFIKKH